MRCHVITEYSEKCRATQPQQTSQTTAHIAFDPSTALHIISALLALCSWRNIIPEHPALAHSPYSWIIPCVSPRLLESFFSRRAVLPIAHRTPQAWHLLFRYTSPFQSTHLIRALRPSGSKGEDLLRFFPARRPAKAETPAPRRARLWCAALRCAIRTPETPRAPTRADQPGLSNPTVSNTNGQRMWFSALSRLWQS